MSEDILGPIATRTFSVPPEWANRIAGEILPDIDVTISLTADDRVRITATFRAFGVSDIPLRELAAVSHGKACDMLAMAAQQAARSLTKYVKGGCKDE